MISKLASVTPNKEDSPEALAELERISAQNAGMQRQVEIMNLVNKKLLGKAQLLGDGNDEVKQMENEVDAQQAAMLHSSNGIAESMKN